MIRFSVIICTYNRIEFLKRSLNSAITQSFLPCEIIIVDAGEQLGEDVVYKCKTKTSHVQLNYLHIKAANVCVMRNIGANHAVGKYLVFLDDDDYWSEEYLEKLKDIIESNGPEIILTSTWKIKDGETFPYKNAPEKIDVKTFIVKNNGCMGSNICIDKEAYHRISGFDETLPSCDDMDFAIRVAQNGLKYYRLEDRLVYYQSHYGPRQSMRPHPVLLFGIPQYYLRYKELMYPHERKYFFNRCEKLWALGLKELESLLIDNFRQSFIRTGAMVGSNVHIDYLLSTGYWSQLYVGMDRVKSSRVSVKILFPKYDEVSSRWQNSEIQVPEQLTSRFKKAEGTDVGLERGDYYREYQILTRIFPGEVHWIKCFGTYAIIYPFFEGINVRNWVRRTKLNPDRINRVIRNLQIELNKMHSLNILHRDLHPNNILVDEDENVRVIDFGKSVLFNSENGYWGIPPFSEIRNNREFYPPEAIGKNDTFQDPSIDLYALKSLENYLKAHLRQAHS